MVRQTRFDRLHKLGRTDFGNKLTRGLVRQTRWDRFAHFGETEMLLGETEMLLGGTDHSLRLDRNVTKGNKEITIPSR